MAQFQDGGNYSLLMGTDSIKVFVSMVSIKHKYFRGKTSLSWG